MDKNTMDFIKNTIEKIIEEEKEAAMKEVNAKAFAAAKKVFEPLIKYGVISNSDFTNVCIDLGITVVTDTKASKNTNKFFNNDSDPCSRSGYVSRSSC